MRRLCSCALLLTALAAQPPATRDLFPERPVCRVPSKEVRVGREMFQVFSDGKSGKELFRIHIGRLHEKEWLKLWTYGVRNCGDFNRDGVLDYTWTGGDDTTNDSYLILSGRGIIDLAKTFQQAWTRQYGGKAPAIGDVGDGYWLHRVTFHWFANEMRISAELRPYGPGKAVHLETVLE